MVRSRDGKGRRIRKTSERERERERGQKERETNREREKKLLADMSSYHSVENLFYQHTIYHGMHV